MHLKDWLSLAGFIVLAEGAGLIGSVFTTPSIPEWYASLAKPELAPPNWIFAPVWTTLFLFMGIAAFLVWRKGFERRDVKIALGIFVLQLVLNILWSIIFFGIRSPGVAFIEILFFWSSIVATMVVFANIVRRAMWLLVPYIVWVSFAAYLNYIIWVLNIP